MIHLFKCLFWVLAFFLFTSCVPSNKANHYGFSTHQLNYLHTNGSQELLNKKVEDQGVVFVIPYRLFKKQGRDAIALFLGRERIDGKPKKRGMWSEFGGGSSEDPTSVYENLNREFFEETMGQLKLNPQTTKEKGVLFFSISQKNGWPYWGVAYPLSDPEFKKSLTFNELRQNKTFTQVLSPEQLEKDQFYWFDLDDLMRADKAGDQPIRIKPLFVQSPPFIEVRLRTHFTKFFLNHPAFQAFIQQVTERVDAAA